MWPISLNQLPAGSALVGGAVRDALLDVLQHKPDLDLIVPSKAVEFAKEFSDREGGSCVVLDKERDIARLVLNGWTIDLACQVGNSLEEDLWRRDYTINAIALTLSNDPIIIDPTGGILDLEKKKLVAISQQNLIDDPLRLLRGFRLSSELRFDLDEMTKNFIKINAKLLKHVAPERIKGELERLVHGDWADQVILQIKKLGLLEPWQSTDQFFTFNNQSLETTSAFHQNELKIALPIVRLTNLLSDQGLKELSFSRKKLQNCHLLRFWQHKNDGLAFETLDEIERLQLHKDLETFLPALILQLPQRDQSAWLKRWRDNADPLFHPSCPIDGFTLQEMFQSPKGPWIGQLMNLLCKERAFGRLHNRKEAFQLARYWWEHNQPFCD
ncbi:CCA tRNA nucleotidyltransferase [Prochlorococcus marinus]|nr:CCA tRNA nucleotidyltransferase [Prochlorococcus marinus]